MRAAQAAPVAAGNVDPQDDGGTDPDVDGGGSGSGGSGGSSGQGGQGGGSPNECGDGNCFGSETCASCEDDCGACEGDCNEPHTSPGCSDADIQECVCGMLFLCCTSQWHEDCASCVQSEGCCGS